ncbi:plasma membrane calcium [Podospora bellae-mahoneyi]|uniref:Plasma membrane calcium n=1 Tax=Podospora bellae-mahoneyi TaxID=2093777 RepID=A0ABR0F876_9PEZI|nr:plasma membrane calcium [Podospora bellae-mahoneyi]
MTSQNKSKEAPREYGRRDYLSASELNFESIAGYLKLSDDVEKSDEANMPDFPVSTDLPVSDNQFTFAPGQLNKLFDPKSLSVLYKLGGLAVSGGASLSYPATGPSHRGMTIVPYDNIPNSHGLGRSNFHVQGGKAENGLSSTGTQGLIVKGTAPSGLQPPGFDSLGNRRQHDTTIRNGIWEQTNDHKRFVHKSSAASSPPINETAIPGSTTQGNLSIWRPQNLAALETFYPQPLHSKNKQLLHASKVSSVVLPWSHSSRPYSPFSSTSSMIPKKHNWSRWSFAWLAQHFFQFLRLDAPFTVSLIETKRNRFLSVICSLGPILWKFLKRNPISGALQNGDEGAGAWIDDATLVGVVAVVAGISNAERSLFVRDDLEGGNHPVLPELESGGWDGAGINRSGVGHQPGGDGGAKITSIN